MTGVFLGTVRLLTMSMRVIRAISFGLGGQELVSESKGVYVSANQDRLETLNCVRLDKPKLGSRSCFETEVETPMRRSRFRSS